MDAPAPHRRFAAVLRQRITDGTYPPGSVFPSHRWLAEEHRIGVGTAYQAVAALRREGLLTGRPGARLTVAYPPAVRTLTNPDAPWPYPTGEQQGPFRRRADPDLAIRLHVPPGAAVNMWRVDLLDPDLRPAMLLTTWRRGTRALPHHSYRCTADPRHTFTPDEAAALGLAAGTPAMRLERTRYDEAGRVVETADLILPADRWTIAL